MSPGKVLGPCSYYIMINSGVTVRRHVDHIKSCVAGERALVVPELELEGQLMQICLRIVVSLSQRQLLPSRPIRRSSRVRRPPERYQPVWS